jgi:hypothetical protein
LTALPEKSQLREVGEAGARSASGFSFVSLAELLRNGQ